MTLRPTLVEPRQYDEPLTHRPMWAAPTLDVYLSQEQDAVMSTVQFSRDGAHPTLELTLPEVRDLIDALENVLERGTSSVFELSEVTA